MRLVVVGGADVVNQMSDGAEAEWTATRLVGPCFDAIPAELAVEAGGDDRLNSVGARVSSGWTAAEERGRGR